MFFKNILITVFCCVSFAGMAQIPLNDDCSGVFDFGVAPACISNVFTNDGATPSTISADPARNVPACFKGDLQQRDVWFVFTCSDTLVNYRIKLTGTGTKSIRNPQFAVYRGDCTPEGLAEIFCAVSEPGATELSLDMTDLTSGARYYIRVSDYSSVNTPNSGTFNLCVDRIPPIITIAQGGSTLSSGILYDSGGPNGDYGKNEKHTFSICPNNKPACITLTFEYYDLEASTGGTYDKLVIYDGDNTLSKPLITLGGILDSDGGGGVCLPVQATSGCMTLSFLSDGAFEKSGWKARWVSSEGPCKPEPFIGLDTAATITNIASFLETEFTKVSVANVQCPRGAYATFSYPNDKNILGLEKGLLLTNGSAIQAFGPGDSFASFPLITEQDADLDYLSAQEGSPELKSTDACVVNVDVFITSDELSFEYVFGSEEYPDYANTEYNDIFAFLVSGPGINGDPQLGNAQNIALLPGTNIPIQINSINNIVNWPYYRDNRLSRAIAYNGLTADSLGQRKSLVARAKVTPCNTYRLKFAIADRYNSKDTLGTGPDKTYDSGVFISKIKGGGPQLSARYGSGIDYLIESCSGNLDRVVMALDEAKSVPASYIVRISGTAQQGADYELDIPSVVTFQAGQKVLSFPILPKADNIKEGTETIVISISSNFGCGEVVFSSVTLQLRDNANVEIQAPDTLYVCAGASVQLEATGATDYIWTPPGIFSNPFSANPIFTATEDRWISVQGSIAGCTDTDSIFIDVTTPFIRAKALGDTVVCLGQSVQLRGENNVRDQGLSWSPAQGLVDPLRAHPIAKPSGTTTFYATIALPGCTVKDSIKITVDTLFMPNLLFKDTLICQNLPLVLTDSLYTTGGSLYQWTPAEGLNNATISQPVATPDQETRYTLIARSARGVCKDTASLRIRITPADVEIGPAVKELCLGQTATLTATVNPGSADAVHWSPSFEVSAATGAVVKATPQESVTITATYRVNGCTVYDSVRLKVDSLPYSMMIRLDPPKPIYCPGDTIILVSKTYEPASFPDIVHEWLSGPGTQETPPDLWNMIVTATESDTFRRVTVNGGCRDTTEVFVKVGVIPEIMVTATPAKICAGQEVQINATVKPAGEKLKWQDNPALSCTECANPTARPAGPVTFIVTTPDADCPGSGSVTVEVAPPPVIDLLPEIKICPGDSVRLNRAPSEAGVTYSWQSTPAGVNASSSSITVLPTQTTTYTLVAVGQCTTQQTSRVEPLQASISAGNDLKACFGVPVALNATVTGTPGIVIWQPGSLPGASVNVTPSQSGTYTATLLYGTNNTCRTSDQVNVEVSPRIILEAVSTPSPGDTLCAGTPVKIRITQLSPVGIPVIWEQNGTRITPVGDSINVAPGISQGRAGFVVRTANTFNCPDKTVQFNYDIKRCFAIPNVFTPDGDQINDTFGPLFLEGAAQIVRFEIYNRWGNKVFSGSQNSPRWNGNVGNDAAPTDVYIYHLTVRYPDGLEDPVSGEVTLLR